MTQAKPRQTSSGVKRVACASDQSRDARAAPVDQRHNPPSEPVHQTDDPVVGMQVVGQSVWQRLSRMKDPLQHKDIVSLGIVQDVEVQGRTVMIRIVSSGGDRHLDEALVDAIRREVGSLDGVDTVRVRLGESPVVAEDADESIVHLNVLGPQSGLTSPGTEMMPEVDFSDWGQPDGPSSDTQIPQDRYEGWPPVFQWEVDPADPSIERGEAETVLGQWEYSIWWQTHPAGLVYVSIQAMQEDMAGPGSGRPHPMGRNVAVNLVYDTRRVGIIAVYGTARDFRPFVEAFRQAFDLTKEA